MTGNENVLPVPIQLVLGGMDHIERENVSAVPYYFTISTEGKWEMLISAGDLEVKKGDIIQIPIKKTVVYENTVSLPCAFCHHALGTVLKVQSEGAALVESERIISNVVFLPILDGIIKKGDLLGVINVFPIIVNR
ncbi:MAG: hypothetical protein C5S40_06175 [ANME-2 cluster archaeon]|nr:hypothetical protein [ANME-2 cluster archaeon]